MTQKFKDEDERLAWDRYVAAALDRALQTTAGGSVDEHLRAAAKRAGEIADRLVLERRLRKA